MEMSFTSSSGIKYSMAEIRRMGRKQPKQQGDTYDPISPGKVTPIVGSYSKSVVEPDLKVAGNDGLPFSITKVWSISGVPGSVTGRAYPDSASENFELGSSAMEMSHSLSIPHKTTRSLQESQHVDMSFEANKHEFILQDCYLTLDQVFYSNGAFVTAIERIPGNSTNTQVGDFGSGCGQSNASSDSDALPVLIGKSESTEPSSNMNTNEEESDLEDVEEEEKTFPKPPYSYACLIAMALKNSHTGCLPVSEIYRFLFDHFPYFKTAAPGWKDQIRSYLKTKYFEKSSRCDEGVRKGNFWTTNPAMIPKFDKEMQKWSSRNFARVHASLSDPENLELLEKGELIRDYSGVIALPLVANNEAPVEKVATPGRPRGRPKGSKGRKNLHVTVPNSSPPSYYLQVVLPSG